MDTQILPQKPQNFCCSNCQFITSNKKDYIRHLSTQKHKNRENDTNMIQKNPKKPQTQYECAICKKTYKYPSGLYRHKKKCLDYENNDSLNYQLSLSKELILDVVKQQQNQIQELTNTIKELIPKVGNNITTTNQKFNIQVFLNEKCKDAFNITDFINGIDVGFKDFENFGRLGYVGSINNILIRELKGLDVYKRPIHCSDLKREVIHIKDNDTWVKDEDKKHMKRAIKLIEHKNIKLVPGWLKANPKADDITTKKHEEYMTILDNSMGEMKDEDNERNYEKIIRNVAKEILIDKEK